MPFIFALLILLGGAGCSFTAAPYLGAAPEGRLFIEGGTVGYTCKL